MRNDTRTLLPVRETGWIVDDDNMLDADHAAYVEELAEEAQFQADVDAGWEWNASINWVGDVAEPIWGNPERLPHYSIEAPCRKSLAAQTARQDFNKG